MLNIGQILLGFQPIGSITQDSRDDLRYLENFSEIGTVLSNACYKIRGILDQWLFSANWAINGESYKESLDSYNYYKKKIKRLVEEIEKIRASKRPVPKSKFVKLQRVRNGPFFSHLCLSSILSYF